LFFVKRLILLKMTIFVRQPRQLPLVFAD